MTTDTGPTTSIVKRRWGRVEDRAGCAVIVLLIALAAACAVPFVRAVKAWDDELGQAAKRQFEISEQRCWDVVMNPSQRPPEGFLESLRQAFWSVIVTLSADEVNRRCSCVGGEVAKDFRAFFDERVRTYWIYNRTWSRLAPSAAQRLQAANEEWRTSGTHAAFRRQFQACIKPR